MATAGPLQAGVTSGRIAVVDVGSNSIRLVVFDGLKRSPVTIFNEKVLCGLGRGLAGSGRLHPDGVKLALANLVRFVTLARGMGVARFEIIATAAVRDAADGPDFIAEVERRSGAPVRLIAGEEEARLAALGVLSAIPQADGLAGDLGGGSLELVMLDGGAIGAQATLPIGPLRLAEASGGDHARARALIDQALAGLPWLKSAAGRNFYPIGGSWRAMGRIHMAQSDYPLSILHHYVLRADQARDLTRIISGLGRQSLVGIPGVPRERLDALPYAALLLDRLLDLAAPTRLVFSAHGLREGYLFDLLAEEMRVRDPLIEACREFAGRTGGGAVDDDVFMRWTAPLFPDETAAAAQLRRAACLLSDIGLRVHPDFRAHQSFERIVQIPYVGLDHGDRVFLACAILARYGGDPEAASGFDFVRILRLLEEPRRQGARRLGLALRLAHTLCGGHAGLLEGTSVRLGEGELILNYGARAGGLHGRVVAKRLKGLARLYGCTPRVEGAG